MESKKRLDGITFARAFCAIGIIIFHFFCHSHSKIRLNPKFCVISDF